MNTEIRVLEDVQEASLVQKLNRQRFHDDRHVFLDLRCSSGFQISMLRYRISKFDTRIYKIT